MFLPSDVGEDGEADIYRLRNCPFLLNSREAIAGRLGASILQKAGLVPNISVTSENLETLLTLCAQGAGACFTSLLLARHFLTARDLAKLRVLRLGASYPLYLAWRDKSYVSRAILYFAEICAREKASGALLAR